MAAATAGSSAASSTIAFVSATTVSGCLYCSRSLAEAAAASEQWERRGWLGRLVRVTEAQTVAAAPVEEESAAKAA
jgi:hypothetical protein